MKTTLQRSKAMFITGALFLGIVSTAWCQARIQGGQVTIPESSVEHKKDVGRRAHTNIKLFTPAGGLPEVSSAATSGPPFPSYFFETPASLACIYNLNLAAPSDGCNPNRVSSIFIGQPASCSGLYS